MSRRDQGVGDILTRRDRRQDEAGRGLRRQVLEAVHRQVGRAVEDRPLDLLGEQPGARPRPSPPAACCGRGPPGSGSRSARRSAPDATPAAGPPPNPPASAPGGSPGCRCGCTRPPSCSMSVVLRHALMVESGVQYNPDGPVLHRKGGRPGVVRRRPGKKLAGRPALGSHKGWIERRAGDHGSWPSNRWGSRWGRSASSSAAGRSPGCPTRSSSTGSWPIAMPSRSRPWWRGTGRWCCRSAGACSATRPTPRTPIRRRS